MSELATQIHVASDGAPIKHLLYLRGKENFNFCPFSVCTLLWEYSSAA